MTYSIHNPEAFALPLPITQQARQIAQQFASQQPTAEKAEQVRLNTLAVCVVNDYLQLMEIATDLTASDSWNPVIQLCADVSDLQVVGLGRLECRPVQQTPTCYVPPEVWQDRIGYVAVQINEADGQAIVLGFTSTVSELELPLNRLQAPEALLDRLEALRTPDSVSTPEAPQVNLGQWLQNTFEAGWQTLDSLLNPPEWSPAFAFRGRGLVELPTQRSETNIQRAKQVYLGIQMDDRPLILSVELEPQSNHSTRIFLRIYPAATQFLPPDLHLTILDATGATFLEAVSRSADNYLQLEISGESDERFTVQISLNEVSVVESFVI
ncbi:MAG: DUF1822 family protein [Scytolyngbya sp. HA4215-MV1]|jgi:hypothetical protein|nr:DUF1822 family protein [Scytolyngbya sp. HA4215-MV1]